MRRLRTLIALTLALLALALILSACSGGDEEEPTTTAAPSEAPSGGAAPPSVGALPPEFVQCMEDQGIAAESIPDQIHSPEGDACFQSLHGGGAP